MTTRDVSRSWLTALALVSATAILVACGGGSSGGSGGSGGSGECSDDEVKDENGDCVAGGGGSGGDMAGSGGTSSGSGGAAMASGGSGGMAIGGKGGTPMATGGAGGMGGMAMGTGGMAMGTGGMAMGTGGMPQVSTFPCKTNCKVLVVGDGLAAGTGSGASGGDGAGYRTVLKTALGAQFTLVGTAGTPPHEGMKGRDAAGLLTALPGFITANKPDLIVISVGAEDIKGGKAANLQTRVMAVVNKAVELAPNAGIVVTSVSVYSGAPLDTLKKYNTDLAKLLLAQTAAGKHVRFVGIAAVLCGFGCTGPLGNEYYSTSPYPSAKGYADLADLISAGAKGVMKL